MENKDVRIEIDQQGIKIQRKSLFEDVFKTSKEILWDEVDSLDISEIGDLDREKRGDTMEYIVSNASIGIVEDSSDSFINDLQDSTGLVYHRRGNSVDLPEETSSVQAFKNFVQYMFDCDKLGLDDLPVKLPNAKVHYILNTEPENIRGEEVDHYDSVQTTDGPVYFNPKAPVSQKKEHIAHLIQEFGL
jgi:hypothetical protein